MTRQSSSWIFVIPFSIALAACSSDTSDQKTADEIAAQTAEGPPAGPPAMPPPTTLSSRAGATGGEALYLEKCAMCHDPVGMGTGLLARRVDQALLEERTDLTPDFVVQAARLGIGNMPAISRGEVSDDELDQIADYLSDGNDDT